MYPHRPGAEPCLYYLKTGKCNYARRCKFDHPPRDKRLLTALSRRYCFDFVQSGSCPYGSRCKYNHPPSESSDGVQPQSRVQCIQVQALPVPSLRSLRQWDSGRLDCVNTSQDDSDRASLGLVLARSEGTSIWSSSPDDPISMLQEGVRPFEWSPSNSIAAKHKPSQGFNPLDYDTQLFGSRFHWAPASPF